MGAGCLLHSAPSLPTHQRVPHLFTRSTHIPPKLGRGPMRPHGITSHGLLKALARPHTFPDLPTPTARHSWPHVGQLCHTGQVGTEVQVRSVQQCQQHEGTDDKGNHDL